MLVLALVTAAMAGRTKCPVRCLCSLDDKGRKKVLCDTGALKDPLPVTEMPPDTEVLIVEAPLGMHNSLTLGPIFRGLRNLEILHVTRSNVPAIGEHSFWGLRSLTMLNISFNNITNLVSANFRGPEQLKHLDLSYNLVESMPSAVFHHLKNLKVLNLGDNNIPELVPSVFFGLTSLISLDISRNPLGDLMASAFTDLPNLIELKCSGCSLNGISEEFLQYLPKLEKINLSNNIFTQLPSFKTWKNLKVVDLSDNLLTHIFPHALSGTNLHGISLSNNRIKSISPDIFENSTSLTHFDISYNRLGLMNIGPVESDSLLHPDSINNSIDNSIYEYYSGPLEFLIPVASNLRRLIFSGNFLKSYDLQIIMKQTRQLRFLGLGDLGLTKIPANLLRQARHLRILNVSGNALNAFPSHLLYSTPNLQSLHLNYNNFRGLSNELIKAFRAMRSLHTIRLDNNPWICDKCQISFMLEWLQKDSNQPHSTRKCRSPDGSHLCLRCAGPSLMSGLELPLLREEELPLCGPAEPSRWPAWLGKRTKSVHPRMMGVGLMEETAENIQESESSIKTFFKDHLTMLVGIGCGLVLALLILVIAAVVAVKRHSALYYTSEEEIERQEKLVARNNNDSPVSRTTQTTSSPVITPKFEPYKPMAISRLHARTPITHSAFNPIRAKMVKIPTIDETTVFRSASSTQTSIT